jgi:enoyl-CoA hydratase/carnithine racemase
MPTNQPLRVDRHDDGVVLVTFALPERRNAMTAELTDAWVETMTSLRADRDVRAVVVTGEGTAFCAGGDVSWLAESPDLTVDDIRARMLPFYRSWLSIKDLDVPTIAAINGPAIGAGLCVALACDLRYAAASAYMSVPFTRLGMHPGMATTWMLPEVVGLPVARELLFTGRSVDADEAARLGLVNGVYGDDALLEEVLGVASRIAANAPVAVRLTKVAMARGGHRSIGDALEWEALAQPVTLGMQDLREGLAAIKAKRPPTFTGR